MTNERVGSTVQAAKLSWITVWILLARMLYYLGWGFLMA